MGIFQKIGVQIKDIWNQHPVMGLVYLPTWKVELLHPADVFLKTTKNTVDGSEIRRSPVEVGSLSHLIWFYTFQGGAGFLPSKVFPYDTLPKI